MFAYRVLSPRAVEAVAADSGNGISAILPFDRYVFVNADLSINLLRKPQGEWICLEARTRVTPTRATQDRAGRPGLTQALARSGMQRIDPFDTVPVAGPPGL